MTHHAILYYGNCIPVFCRKLLQNAVGNKIGVTRNYAASQVCIIGVCSLLQKPTIHAVAGSAPFPSPKFCKHDRFPGNNGV